MIHTRPLDRIFFDIVNVCNLACPFCSFDYSTVKKGHIIDYETFDEIIKLAEVVPEGNFSLSCEHEPTMHPNLVELIQRIPESYRKKFFFTTNICTKISDELIHELSVSNFSYINISIDSIDPKVFESLRVNGKFDVFMYNFKRIHSAFQQSTRAPALRFVTIGLESTFSGIDNIVNFGKEHNISWHEIRYLFDMVHIPADFKKKEVLSPDKWQFLVEKYCEDPRIHIFVPPEGNHAIGLTEAQWVNATI